MLAAGAQTGLQLAPEVVAQPVPPSKTTGLFVKVKVNPAIDVAVAVHWKPLAGPPP